MNISGAMIFLVDTLISMMGYLFLTRFLLQMVQADFYNPLCQGIVKITDIFCKPLRVIPIKNPRFDPASLIWFCLTILLLLAAYAFLKGAMPSSPVVWVISFCYKFASIIINYFIFVLIVGAILSWFNQGYPNPAQQLISQLGDPITAPIRKVIPPAGGFDFSVLIAILALNMIKIAFGL